MPNSSWGRYFSPSAPRPVDTALLLVANYESGVGYAWWLMESFWRVLAEEFHDSERVLLAYPLIDTVPSTIATAPLDLLEEDFATCTPAAVLRQARILFRQRVRVLYLTDHGSVHWRYALYRMVGVRCIIVHDHTPGNRQSPVGWRRVLKRWVHRIGPFRATGLIGPTEFVRRRHIEVNQFPPERCHVAPNGLPLDPEESSIDLRARHGIPHDRVVLVSVGRMSPVKRIDVIIEAVRILVHERGQRGIHFLHLGDGPSRDQLESLVKRAGLAPWVTFAGEVSNVGSYLRSCDVAIHASSGEVGYSLAILEAMRAGLPVVVSDDPSVNGATDPGETGLTFRTDDAVAAADALGKLVADKELRLRLGARAAHVQRERFTLAKTHRALLEAVHTLRSLSS